MRYCSSLLLLYCSTALLLSTPPTHEPATSPNTELTSLPAHQPLAFTLCFVGACGRSAWPKPPPSPGSPSPA
ncbi:hypothetical protein B484DRAFT_447782 [Ochromonadaceae sp. CCMP2298]|nr:hypothetical protein B484DRAFT_447782 [Ochromonadaceae sp. CCMP2298]